MRLGELLINQGRLTEDRLNIALIEQRKSGEQLGKILIQLGFVSESRLRETLGESLDQESIDLSGVVPDADALKFVSQETARQHNILPLSFDSKARVLTLAIEDVFNLSVIDRLRAQIGNKVEIKPVLAGQVELITAIDQFYGYELSIDGILHELETGEINYQGIQAEDGQYDQPLVRLVDAILSDAVKEGASDVHFEPEEYFLRIRYRIDGTLRQIRSLHKTYWSAITVRLKVISGMNIAEARAPQDGRITMQLVGHAIDFRVSSLPTTHGENFVLRILDRDKGIMALDKLGLPEDTLSLLKIIMARPEGIILVTGPTGSGKTTTLYSMLTHINTVDVNIMTLEDPVEYPMTMIRQTSINDNVKLGFADGIRTLMRQDPDIILVGEIRDEDTAEMAFRAAMTGHQVFSTLHTNSAIGTISRLVDIGVSPEVLSGNIIGVLGQRLIRKLCTFCKEAYQPEPFEKMILGLDDENNTSLYKAKGCPKCNDIGYKGRTSLLEVLKIDADMDELIAQRATQKVLLEYAQSKGFRRLADDGIRRVIEGITSLEEISRVIDLTDRI